MMKGPLVYAAAILAFVLIAMSFLLVAFPDSAEMSMSATSHQLRMLRDAHLVTFRKEGKSVFYSLCDEHVRLVLEMALEHIREQD